MLHNDTPRFTPDPMVGLTEEQVKSRINHGLCNTQPDPITKTSWQIIKDNVFTLFNFFNFAVAVAIAAVGAYENLLFLWVIVTNMVIGIIQEFRSKKMVEELSLISAPKANVLRSGKQYEIPQEQLVLDDIAVLMPGQQICADATVMQGEIEVNESLLTGESEPVLKQVGDALLSGSFVVSGRCHCRIDHIGADNYASGIAAAAKRFKKVHSELMDSLDKIVKFTSMFIVPLGALLFLQSYFLLGEPLRDSITATAAALLGMMPKGLVLLTTVSLVVGVIKLAKERTLVQELYCIETLSRVDVLCLDKTGTITQGNMQVDRIIPLMEEGTILQAGRAFVAALNENNSTYLALKAYFKEDGSDVPQAIATTPFSSERKWSSASFQDGTVIIGAPDVLSRGRTFTLPDEIKAAEESGARVVLMAGCSGTVKGELPQTITPMAALLLMDPIRTDAREILDFFRAQDVQLKIISGDNPATVAAIAQKAGLKDCSYVDASTLKDDEALADAMERFSVFGRVTPQQKQKMVAALQSRSHTVAMMGDGVNDVLALKDADCSIAMAAGSDAAKQISQLVLLDNNFSALPQVVMEGRRVINNITSTASLYLVKTIFSFLLSFLALFFGMPYPFIPIQLSLITTMTEGIPSFFLTFEPNHNRVKKSFLSQVLMGAMPTALTITLAIVLLDVLTPNLGFTPTELSTLIVYITGFVWIQLLLKVCWPLTPMRLILWIAMTVGLFGACLIVPGLLGITYLSAKTLPTFILMGALSIPVTMLIRKAMVHIPFLRKKLFEE
ncbi:MAG: HAD family hydrolase [Clostridiales bacterium]|nr:HAD family hydrolase [Clostridiales bacterium]